MIAPELALLLAECGVAKLPIAQRRIKQLRLARLLDVRGRGKHAAPVTESGLTNAILAACIDERSDIASAIARARAHPGDVLVVPATFQESATFHRATTAGEALDAFFSDLRNRRLNHELAIDISIESSGDWIGVGARIPSRDLFVAASSGFFITGAKNTTVERTTRIGGDVLWRLALALGPP